MNNLRKEFESILMILKRSALFKEYMIQDIYFAQPTEGSKEGYYVYEKNNVYYLDYFERGKVTSSKQTAFIDECLYFLVDSVVSTMGYKYEVSNRVPNQDTRRVAFRKMEEIYSDLPSNLLKLKHEHLSKILIDFPFDDELFKKS